jgi:hypothetical protein
MNRGKIIGFATEKKVVCEFCRNLFPLARFVEGNAIQRFGKSFCSREHLNEYAKTKVGYFTMPSFRGHAMIEFR